MVTLEVLKKKIKQEKKVASPPRRRSDESRSNNMTPSHPPLNSFMEDGKPKTCYVSEGRPAASFHLFFFSQYPPSPSSALLPYFVIYATKFFPSWFIVCIIRQGVRFTNTKRRAIENNRVFLFFPN